MNTRVLVGVFAAWSAFAVWCWAGGPASRATVIGDYVEIRSCDVYTGPCFANGEMGLAGREAVLAWSVRQGSWQGATLDGLSVLAVVRADGTLGDVRRCRRAGKAVLIVDAKADPTQREALAGLAKHLAGPLLRDVVRVETAPIEIEVHPSSCPNSGCSNVRAEGLVEIQTRCLGEKDHVCGNEERFYPPLTPVHDSRPAFTVIGQFRGKGLGIRFDDAGRRSAYLAEFTL